MSISYEEMKHCTYIDIYRLYINAIDSLTKSAIDLLCWHKHIAEGQKELELINKLIFWTSALDEPLFECKCYLSNNGEETGGKE